MTCGPTKRLKLTGFILFHTGTSFFVTAVFSCLVFNNVFFSITGGRIKYETLLICSFTFQQANSAHSCLQLPSCWKVIKCKVIKLLLGRILLDGFRFDEVTLGRLMSSNSETTSADEIILYSVLTGTHCKLFSLQTFWHVKAGKAQMQLMNNNN